MFLTLFCFQAICCSSLVAKHKKNKKNKNLFSITGGYTAIYFIVHQHIFTCTIFS